MEIKTKEIIETKNITKHFTFEVNGKTVRAVATSYDTKLSQNPSYSYDILSVEGEGGKELDLLPKERELVIEVVNEEI